MAHPWLLIALALLADGLAGMTGGLFSERWLFRHQASLLGLAAGALLAAVFLDILPEALDSFGRTSLTLALSSFVLLAIIEWLFGRHHYFQEQRKHRALPAMLLGGDALHNTGDGAAVAAAFLLSPRAGLATALAVIVHEVPQEVGDYAILRATGFSRRRALLALAGVQLTSTLGAAGVIALATYSNQLTGAVISIAAGTFLYIGATDLLPEVQTGRSAAERIERMLGFLAGVLLIVLAGLIELH